MKVSRHSFALAAALAGLAGGIAARADQPAPNSPAFTASFADKKIEKHACKGMNSCKGQGGGSKAEWGKNACKGKGACATDGSKPKA